ncbi:unnamed protein product [marine sediment metagenome]|uniref:Uncharacterized protein n=1 Tax=marine sediment metagenome TaxID=412755 RepID=X0XM78_9ZZZZ
MELRCPECHRFGIAFNPLLHTEVCPWKDCLFMNIGNIDLTKVKHPIRFWKFINAIRRKVYGK